MKLLVVIDMQNDFVTGSLGTPEAVAIVPAVTARVAAAVDAGDTVVFTRDDHHEATYMDSLEGRLLPVPHCYNGTEGWQIIPALLPYAEGRIVFDKPTFGGLELARWAVEQGFEAIELIGLCTDICVLSNAILLRAALPNTPITVDAACCAGVSPQSHSTALDAMGPCQIQVVNR